MLLFPTYQQDILDRILEGVTQEEVNVKKMATEGALEDLFELKSAMSSIYQDCNLDW